MADGKNRNVHIEVWVTVIKQKRRLTFKPRFGMCVQARLNNMIKMHYVIAFVLTKAVHRQDEVGVFDVIPEDQ